MKGLSVIVPVYNEQESISETINNLKKYLKNKITHFEIIVVNDCSDDDSLAILKQFDYITIVNHEVNKGYGASLKSGIHLAKYDKIAITDADGTYPNEMIPELFNASMEEDYDMIVGARVGGKVKIPALRKPAKFFLNKLANYLAGYRIPDLNSGLRIMKKNLLYNFINILPDGFSFTMTITLAMLTNGYRVKYIPIDYHKRSGKSKIRPISDTIYFFQLIIRTVMYFNPLKIFLPFSLLFFIPGVTFLIRDIIRFNIAQTSVLLLVSGSIILSIGLLADLINKRLR